MMCDEEDGGVMICAEGRKGWRLKEEKAGG
jgi:hypothetical protein